MEYSFHLIFNLLLYYLDILFADISNWDFSSFHFCALFAFGISIIQTHKMNWKFPMYFSVLQCFETLGKNLGSSYS